MQWLWPFGAVVLGILVFVQVSTIAELQDDARHASEYAQSLEKQAQALHKEVINQHVRTRELALELSGVTAERNACVLQNVKELVVAPQSRVDISSVVISENAAMINVANLTPGIIAPTGSMYPLLQEDTIVLEQQPASHNDLLPGDIIVFEYKDTRIIHRIVQVGWDDEGWYAMTKGDNNPLQDPSKVRFESVKGVVVGIIY